MYDCGITPIQCYFFLQNNNSLALTLSLQRQNPSMSVGGNKSAYEHRFQQQISLKKMKAPKGGTSYKFRKF